MRSVTDWRKGLSASISTHVHADGQAEVCYTYKLWPVLIEALLKAGHAIDPLRGTHFCSQAMVEGSDAVRRARTERAKGEAVGRFLF